MQAISYGQPDLDLSTDHAAITMQLQIAHASSCSHKLTSISMHGKLKGGTTLPLSELLEVLYYTDYRGDGVVEVR